MKVVLFCGGLGLRLRDHPDGLPKPMVTIGHRPIIWHIMRYYAHFGHTDFILCLGYGAQAIKDYFLSYNEAMSNDFVLSNGGRDVELLATDIDEWNITFVDTGRHASVGERLLAVREYIDDDVFLANYGDGLSNLNLNAYIDTALSVGRIASFVAVHPAQTFHVADIDPSGSVHGLSTVADAELWVNGGFFVLRREVFDYMQRGEDLVVEPFARLIDADELYAYKHDGGFWVMDTFKDYMELEDLYSSGEPPWEVWVNAAVSPERRRHARVPD
jgi:glucose-1-phosphate cytidylyltransferase